MVRTLIAILAVIAGSFLSGWYAALHQQAFFNWLAGVGEYVQVRIEKQCIPPEGYTCIKTAPLDNQPTATP